MPMFRRETIIALRARHEAFRIATTITHPPVEPPPLATPAVPPPPLDRYVEQGPPPDPRVESLITGCTLVVLGVVGFLVGWFVYYYGPR